MGSFTVLHKGTTGGFNRKGYDEMFSGKIVATVSKTSITLVGDTLKVLGNPEFVELLNNTTEWAIRPAETRYTGYKISQHKSQNEETNRGKYIAVEKHIKGINLPVGYYFEGTLRDGMVIFNKVPSGKL